MTDEKLAQLANTESWQIVKKLLNQTARQRYGWNTDKDLKEAKGVNEYKDLIIRKVEGAKDSLPTKTTADKG